jgi:transcriptional regulator with XRE-family HTH domain
VSEGTGGDRLAAFGRWLARERELRGLGRDEVTRATRLAPGVVEALESGDRQRLPPRAYAIGYLRSYASAVGLDADEVVLRWEEALAGGPAEVARTGPRNGRVLVALVLLALAGLAALALLRR